MPVSSTTVRVAGLTDVGLERTKNDDSFIIEDLNAAADDERSCGTFTCLRDGVLLAVADGLGGHADGDIASRAASRELARAMREEHGRTADRVRRGVEQAHQAVRELAKGREGAQRMGTTLTALHIDGRRAHIGHVGDSRIYLARGGVLALLTSDQTTTEAMIAAGLMDDAERESSPWAHQLTQVVGQAQKRLTVAASTLELRQGDRFVLCSDGLTNAVGEDEILRALGDHVTLEAACRWLVDLGNLRGGDDNITVVLAEVQGDDLPTACAHEAIASTHHLIQTYDGTARVRALLSPWRFEPAAVQSASPSRRSVNGIHPEPHGCRS